MSELSCYGFPCTLRVNSNTQSFVYTFMCCPFYRRFQVFDMLRARDARRSTLLMTAVAGGSMEVLELVLRQDQVRSSLLTPRLS